MKRQNNQIHPSQSHLIYEVSQNTRVTPLTIQQILNNSSKTQYQQSIKRTFDLLQRLRVFKNQPHNSQLQQIILHQLQSFKSPSTQKKPPQQQKKLIQTQKKQPPLNYDQFRFDINRLYTMNKSGSIGMIQRKCKFTEKGVLEFQDGKKQPKLKEITRFNNLIERYNQKTNISKLDWLKQSGKYPYRIVLIDKNKADKGIYFQSVAQAYSVQAYLIQKYNLKAENNNKIKELFGKTAVYKESQLIQNLVSKFKPYSINRKQLRNSYEKTKQNTEIKMVEGNFSRQHKITQSKFDSQSILDNNKNRQSNTLSQYFINEKRGSNPILIEDTRSQVNQGFKKIQKNAGNTDGGNKKGVNLEINLKRLNDKLRNYNETNLKELLLLWRLKVNKINNNFRNDGRETENTIKIRGDNSVFGSRVFDFMESDKDVEREVVQEQDEKNKLTNMMKFTSLQLYFTPNIPLKPYVQIELVNQQELKRESQILKFSTFLSINPNHLEDSNSNCSYYELIKQNNKSKGFKQLNNDIDDQILISSDYAGYFIRLTVMNQVTGDVVIEKQLPLDGIKLNNQTFTLFITNQSQQINDNNLLRQQQQNPPVMSLMGTIENRNRDNLISNTFNYLFMNLDFLNSNPSLPNHQKQNFKHFSQNLINQEQINAQQQMSQNNFTLKNTNLLTLIPELQIQQKQKLNQIIASNSYHLIDQSSYLPIHGLRPLQPTQHQLRILSISAQLFRSLNHPTPISYRYLPILRMLIQTNLFPTEPQLIQAFTAIVLKWTTNFLTCDNSQFNLANVMGFQDDQIDKTSQKITISLLLIQFLLTKQCPSLVQKMNRRNIPLNLLCLQYCHNLLTQNFLPSTTLSLLANIFNTLDTSKEVLLILVTVYLCKYHQDELINCYRLQEVQFILEKSFRNSQNQLSFLEFTHQSLEIQVEQFILQKYNLYFSLDNKHKYLAQFDAIKSHFYEKEGEQLRNKKQQRIAQKSTLTQKFIEIHPHNSISPPLYKPKPHCLHIYFVSVPKISGSLYLRTNYTEFQCVDYEKDPYFVISNLESKVQLEFIDSKSNHYTFDLMFDLGFGMFTHQFNDVKSFLPLKFQYWAGLFDQSSIEYRFKNIKDIESSLSSQLTIRDLKYKLNREFEESKIMRAIEKICFNNGKSDPSLQELSRKIKTSLSEFQNKVNQYDLFLHLVAQRKVSLIEKLYTLFQFAKAIEQELFLSSNCCFDRIVLYDFIKLMEVPIKFREFEALYQNMLAKETETCVPKVFKARFFFMYEEQKEVKLENEVYEYIYSKAEKYLYTDIDIKELLNFVKPKILMQVSQVEKQINRKIKLDEGELKLVISSEGQVRHYLMKVSIRNSNREFDVEEQHLPEISYWSKLEKAVPKVLHHQRKVESQKQLHSSKGNQNEEHFTSALKLMSRFKSNNNNMKSSISIDSRLNPLVSQNNINTQVNSVSDISEFQKTNLCKYIIPKFKKVIPFRYKSYPQEMAFRNFSFLFDFNYFCFGISENRELSSIKQVYLNNKQVPTLEFLNDHSKLLKVGASQNSQLYSYRPEIGLENNLHLIKQKNSALTKVFFSTTEKNMSRQITAKALVNHGFGVIRWENVTIQGYYKVKNQKNHKQKTHYLISVNGKERLAEPKLLKSNSLNQVKLLSEITDKDLTKLQITKL